MRPLRDEPIFNDPDAAQSYLESIRWPNGPFCPFCRETRSIERNSAGDPAGTLLCGTCHRVFKVTSGSFLSSSDVPLPKWLLALQLLSNERNGAARASIQRLFGLTDLDPDLRLMVDGRIVRPSSVDHLLYRFDVSARPYEIRILSRQVVPAEQDPSNKDLRKLGVSLQAIAVESGHVNREWSYDDPALVEGFYPPEGAHRWTKGQAMIPQSYFADLDERFILTIKLSSMDVHYVRRL